MKLVVKETYVVMHNNLRWKGGEVIPPQYTQAVLNTQSWKVEDKDVKEESKTSSSRGAEKEPEQEKEIEEIKVDRMMTEKTTKKRG